MKGVGNTFIKVKLKSNKKLKIAVVVNQFPCVSETFILNQITGLIEKGHDVDSFCRAAV